LLYPGCVSEGITVSSTTLSTHSPAPVLARLGPRARRFGTFGILAIVVACGSSSPGTILGVVHPCPGASGEVDSAAHFEVTVWSGATEVKILEVSSPWRFQLAVAPGSYTVRAGSGEVPVTVTVASNGTVQAVLASDCG
jgi:hypothetical protein